MSSKRNQTARRRAAPVRPAGLDLPLASIFLIILGFFILVWELSEYSDIFLGSDAGGLFVEFPFVLLVFPLCFFLPWLLSSRPKASPHPVYRRKSHRRNRCQRDR